MDSYTTGNIFHAPVLVETWTPPRRTRNSDYVMDLQCLTFPNPNASQDWPNLRQTELCKLKVILFHSQSDAFPPVKQSGDVVYFEYLRAKSSNPTRQACSTYRTRHCVLYAPRFQPSSDQLDSLETFQHAMPQVEFGSAASCFVSQRELQRPGLSGYISFLQAWWLQHRPNSAASLPSPPSNLAASDRLDRWAKRPTLLTKDLVPWKFFDYYAEVIKNPTFPYDAPGMNPVTLTLTDYTEHPALIDVASDGNDTDKVKGRRCIKCQLWDANAQQAFRFQPGCLVFLRNCVAKTSNATLEIQLKGDRRYPEKVNILFAQSEFEPVKELLERRREYLQTFTTTLLPAPTSTSPSSVQPRPPSPKPNDIHRTPDTSPLTPTTIRFPHHPITPLRTVLDHRDPLQKFRVRVRVADCAPLDITQFTRRHCPLCDQSLPMNSSPNTTRCPTCPADLSDDDYIYSFALLVEDSAGDQLRLIVYGQYAAEFLPGLAPTNLHTNNATQLSLVHRLGKIFPPLLIARWPANSEVAPLGTPDKVAPWFDCCIILYTVTYQDQYVRKYQLFGTALS
ncbi:hypothetical protein IWQ61_000622 [Dispira simplex]|nr:hypothetical protein IWQ61_000622 [Dispira simplex]